MQRRRREWLAVNGPCVACGSWKRLKVDHRDPMQKVSHRVWSWSKIRREAELEKCQALCEECHEAKTYAQRFAGKALDTRPRCRCAVCKGRRAVRRRLDRRGFLAAIRQ
ncbi:MAG TPA: hypothetical protein VH092_29590 [Urbifossiella sp.]|nr:hypothetical protein [Urbifossiella sp.]